VGKAAYNYAMKKILTMLAMIILLSFSGCSSGGGSSPVSTVMAPTIVSISPSTGGPGTLVTIQGSRFGNFQGNSIVSYSGVTVAPSSWSDSIITVTVPQNAQNNGTFQVIVGGLASNYSTAFMVSNPIISYISPSTGNPGEQVTVYGQYFGAQQGSSYVSFNAQQAEIVSWNSNAINCRVPTNLGSQSGSVSVVVVVDGQRTSNTVSFGFTVPTISSVSPAGDNIGALITINGQGFGQSQSLVNGMVTIGGLTAQIVSWNDYSIQVKVPQVSYSGAQSLVVTSSGRQITSTFRVEGPEVTYYTPNTADENQLITFYGNHFGTSSETVFREVRIQGYDNGSGSDKVAGVNYSDTSLSFIWPIENTLFGTQTKTVTINIGGLTTTVTVTAN
jgi:hypothetical protein